MESVDDFAAVVRAVRGAMPSAGIPHDPFLGSPCGRERRGRPAVSLNELPLELLVEVAFWLDLRSLLSLERVSARCRSAVALHLARLSRFRVGSAVLDDAELAELLPRLTALRELHVRLSSGGAAPGELMDTLVVRKRYAAGMRALLEGLRRYCEKP